MSDIQERLQTNAEECISKYKAWNSDKKKSENLEALQESIHELRKAVSRLEIEIAVSERDANSGKPIPIPTHRSNGKKDAASHESILPDNGHTDQQDNGAKKQGGQRRSRSRKSASKN
ncbi:MAG: hypothetical protein AAF549_03250 [Pseudomonadota bacterium]